MSALPLLSHPSPDSIVAWRADGAVTRNQFLAEVGQLAALLPAGSHLLNMCSDRYRFSVGLAAAIVAKKISLLPSANTPEVIRQIRSFAPEVFCLTDSDQCHVDLPQLYYPPMTTDETADCAVPQIDGGQCVAILFTSGSTGIPQPHSKTWGALIRVVQAETSRLDLLHANVSVALLGTVPPQHMYGFESTVLMAWHSGNALCHAQPFFPADIEQTLAALPAPRVLVSTPVHLRALLAAEISLPELACVVSATAPLSNQLALDIEAHYKAPLMEIYGSTETGVMATRRPACEVQWHLLPDVKLSFDKENVTAFGAHVLQPTVLNDVIEALDDEHFLLHGRQADLINIAGKRHSLSALNHLLNTIPGVVDGSFYMPDESDSERTTRLAACVVAPDLDAAKLLAALRDQIDPVFLPRPLLFVDELPRNSAGKLPRSALQALFSRRGAVKPVHGHE